MGVRFVLNGRAVIAGDVDAHLTLLHWLRAQGLCGSKEGCAEGECGACAVALVSSEPGEVGSHFEPVNSCLLPLAALDGRQVVTVEGVAEPDGALHPVQAALVAAGGSQCGYCTPGFVVSLFCEYYRPGRTGFDPESIAGNLCRCTGYRPIADVARGLPCPAASDTRLVQLGTRAPALGASESGSAGERFFRPATLAEALELFDAHPGALAIAGGTDLMVYANQRYQRSPALVSLEALRELQELTLGETEIVLGAAVPLSRIEHALASAPTTAGPALLEQLLPLFSSRLIRNRATLGGNLATASPIGDSRPRSSRSTRSVDAREPARRARSCRSRSFFTGLSQDCARAGGADREPFTSPRPLPAVQRFYKVSKRVLDDISTVAAAFALDARRRRHVDAPRVGLRRRRRDAARARRRSRSSPRGGRGTRPRSRSCSPSSRSSARRDRFTAAAPPTGAR